MLISILVFIGGLGATEAVLIFLAIVFLFGAKKIPELARGLGRGIREFKEASKEIRENIEEGVKNAEDSSKQIKN